LGGYFAAAGSLKGFQAAWYVFQMPAGVVVVRGAHPTAAAHMEAA